MKNKKILLAVLVALLVTAAWANYPQIGDFFVDEMRTAMINGDNTDLKIGSIAPLSGYRVNINGDVSVGANSGPTTKLMMRGNGGNAIWISTPGAGHWAACGNGSIHSDASSGAPLQLCKDNQWAIPVTYDDIFAGTGNILRDNDANIQSMYLGGGPRLTLMRWFSVTSNSGSIPAGGKVTAVATGSIAGNVGDATICNLSGSQNANIDFVGCANGGSGQVVISERNTDSGAAHTSSQVYSVFVISGQ